MNGRRRRLPADPFRRAIMVDILAVVPERVPASTNDVASEAARAGVPLGIYEEDGQDRYTLSNERPPARPWLLESALRTMQRCGYVARSSTEDGSWLWRRTNLGTETVKRVRADA